MRLNRVYVLAVLCCALTAACVESRDLDREDQEVPAPPEARSAGSTSPALQEPSAGALQLDPWDSTRIAAYLSARGYSLEQAMDVHSRHYAVVGRRAERNAVVMLLRADSGEIVLLSEPVEVGQNGLHLMPDYGKWESLWGEEADAFVLSWESPFESLVGSTVYARQVDGKFAVVYDDPLGACRPAVVEDRDGDGTPELLTYVDDLTDYSSGVKRACEEPPCAVPFEEAFRMVPAWYGTRSWNGGEWEVGNGRWAEYYSDLARRYEEAAQWVPTFWACAGVPDMDTHLLHWAQRAKERAGLPEFSAERQQP